jgi:mono/diheme cytochrome c family protein
VIRWAKTLVAALAVAGSARVAADPAAPAPPGSLRSGAETYQAICATCHGADGRGEPGRVLLSLEMPDFSDCSFATREADADWIAVSHAGGPARAFSVIMPAFGDSLAPEELARVVAHLRSFCSDTRWPRGELNLPRPLVTEKAYPEDEALIETTAALADADSAALQFIFEKRVGARHQVEIALPIEFVENADTRHRGAGVGDLALAAKSALFHDAGWGTIIALGHELRVPTGDEDRDRGKGTVVFEPFLAAGQVIAENGFLQAQVVGELPAKTRRADPELLTRAALGWTFELGRFGRTLTPMLELQNALVFDGNAPLDEWDLVPQFQLALSKRQHVLFNLGLRVPVSQTSERDLRVAAYLLWDWYDGGLFEGWN